MLESVHQHKIIKGGKLQKSESSLICVVIAEGSTNALQVSTSILAHFCIPVFLHNIFLERNTTDALEYEGTVSIGGRTITNLGFADEIDGLAGEEEELAKLVESLDKAFTANGMEISAEKTKLMTNNTSGINTEIKINGQKL